MSDERADLTNLYHKANLTMSGIEVVECIRHGDPVRRVDGNGFSVCGHFKSKNKMHLSIQFESRTIEYSYAVFCEYKKHIIEYWDQPYRIKLSYVRKDGHKITHLTTPDFLVIEINAVYFVECKPESKLIKLSKKYPEKFVKNEDGTWSCPPAEAAVKDWGIGYRIVSSSQLSAVFTRNCNFMSDYLNGTPPDDHIDIRQTIHNFFKENKTGTLRHLLEYVNDADKVYWALCLKYFYLDLEQHLITAPETAQIYLDESYANALIAAQDSFQPSETINTITFTPGSKLLWDNMPWKIINAGKAEVVLEDEAGNLITLKYKQLEKLIQKGDIKGVGKHKPDQAIETIFDFNHHELGIANDRYEIIAPYLDVHSKSPKSRTHREWLSRFRKSLILTGIGFLGLLPNIKGRGNRESKIHPESEKILNKIIKNEYGTTTCPTKISVFREQETQCKARSLPPCSYETVCQRINQKNKIDLAKKQVGDRGAYPLQGPLPKSEVDLPPDGDRAFEVGHIDHTLTALKVVSSITGEVLGQLWLTILVEAYTKLVLSYYLTFDPPSYRSSMMVIRECVRRYGRIPNSIVVDRGSDFSSVNFDALINVLCDRKLIRPTAQPKYGEPVERVFGTTDTGLINLILGNTQNLSLGRGLSSTHHPDKHAVWTPDAFNAELGNWFYNVYPNLKNTGTGETPNNRYKRSISQTGLRNHTLFTYDETFLRLTMPAPKRLPRVRSNEGIRVNYFSYWHPELGRPDLEGKIVDVLYEPFDPSFVLAHTGQHWVRCTCNHKILREFSERDIKLAYEEVKQLRRIAKQNYRITPEILIEHLHRIKQRQAVLQNEKQNLQKQFETADVTPLPDRPTNSSELVDVKELPLLTTKKLPKK